jgi:hypothetical protein
MTLDQRTAIVSYEAIFDRLTGILEYCRGPLKLAREVEDSRFAVVHAKLGELISAVRAIRAGTATAATTASITANAHLYTVTLVEAHEIGITVDFVTSRSKKEIRSTMRRILAGPLLPDDEDAASNQSRNTPFEIVIASTLTRAGLKAELGEPDVHVTWDSGTVYIACKRMFSVRAIRDRIDEAGAQIRRRLDDNPSAVGLIAMSLSRLLNSSRAAVNVNDRGAAQAALIDWIEQTVTQNVGGLAIADTGAAGLLFHASSPFTNLETGRIDWGEQYVGYGAEPRLQVIAEALSKAAH